MQIVVFNCFAYTCCTAFFQSFCGKCPLSDTTYWMVGHFRMDVTERLLNTKIVVFLVFFLWFSVRFLCSEYLRCLIRLEKCRCFITCVFICTCAKFLKLYVFSTHCILMIINQSSILSFYIFL